MLGHPISASGSGDNALRKLVSQGALLSLLPDLLAIVMHWDMSNLTDAGMHNSSSAPLNGLTDPMHWHGHTLTGVSTLL